VASPLVALRICPVMATVVRNSSIEMICTPACSLLIDSM